MFKELLKRLRLAISQAELPALSQEDTASEWEKVAVVPEEEEDARVQLLRANSHLAFPIEFVMGPDEAEHCMVKARRQESDGSEVVFFTEAALLLEGPVIALAGGSSFNDWKLLWEFIQHLPPEYNYLVSGCDGFVREAVLACNDARLNFEILEHTGDESDVELVSQCTSLIDFLSVDSETGNRHFWAAYARTKNKLALTVPPDAGWAESESRRVQFLESAPWNHEGNLWGPETGKDESNLGE